MITHFYNYYGQTERLAEIYDDWRKFTVPWTTMIVDDGHPIHATLDESQPHRMVRVLEDIPYNFSGTYNLAFALADTEFVLHTDMDVAINAEEAEAIHRLAVPGDPTVHLFRHRDLDGTEGGEACAFWLCPVRTFWKLGGFDEDFTGNYGSEDNHFLWRAQELGLTKQSGLFLRQVPGGRTDMARDVAPNGDLLNRKRPFRFDCTNPMRFPFAVVR